MNMFNSPMIASLLPLIIIILLLGATLLIVKKYAYKFGGKKSGTIAIKAITSLMVAPKKYVTVIKVQDDILLLGISDHSVSLIKELKSYQENEPKNRKVLEQKRQVIFEKRDKTASLHAAISHQNENNDFAAILKKNLGIK